MVKDAELPEQKTPGSMHVFRDANFESISVKFGACK